MRYRLLLIYCMALAFSAAGQERRTFSLNPATQAGDSSFQIIALNDLATKIKKTDPDSALALYSRAYQSSRTLKYTYGAGLSLLNMGMLAYQHGELEESRILYLRALRYALQAGAQTDLVAKLFANISNIYIYYGDYTAAATYLYTALNILGDDLQSTGQENVTMILYSEIGGLHIRFNQLERALYYIRKSEKIARRNKNEKLPSILNNTGSALAAMGRFGEAEAYYREALEIARAMDDTLQSQGILMSIGEMRLQQKKPREAVRVLLEAEQIAVRQDNHPMNIHLNYIIGNAFIRNREYAKARTYLLSGIRLAEKLRIKDDIQNAYANLAEAEAAMGNYFQAWKHQKAHSLYKDSLMDKERSGEINKLEFKYQSIRSNMDITQKKLLISEQGNEINRKNTWIAIASMSAIVLAIVSLMLYRSGQHRQRFQNERLRRMEHEQAILKNEEDIRIMQALISGEEKERTRIAQELHDGIGGRLAAMQMYFSTEQNVSGLQKGYLDEIMNMLEETAGEVRNTAHNLMPDVLSRYSFEDALELYIEQLGSNSRLHTELQIHAAVDCLSPSAQLSLYRIIQELLQNIIKHAHATSATIQINRIGKRLTVMIEDNGKGFNTSEQKSGLGLQNIRNRIRAMNGSMTIESSRERGTIVQFEINPGKPENPEV